MPISQNNIVSECNSNQRISHLRHDWRTEEVAEIFNFPLCDLFLEAQAALRAHFQPNTVQLSTLMNIKSGGCPEDCAYCPQSAHYEVGKTKGSLASLEEVVEAASAAQVQGATRFCMGAAWRSPNAKDLQRVQDMVAAVKALGMETCVTLGMLNQTQAHALKAAGLDYYNHNLDTSESFYPSIISTRTYQDRLDTLKHVREADIRLCAGGIIGLGEGRIDRVQMLVMLANLPQHPESVPINTLVKVAGTPLENAAPVDRFEIVRTIAAARILMPSSFVRLSAGRTEMSDEMQALCFLAGANSVFYGDRLLTTDNPDIIHDRQLFESLGISIAH